MLITIHDVGHGHCAVITCPDGTRMMIDCGVNPISGWRPSHAYAGQHIDLLVIQNLDEDHVEDLPQLWNSASLGAIVMNPTVTPWALKAMKFNDGMRAGVKFAHDLLSSRQPGLVHGQLPLTKGGGAFAWATWNRYRTDFSDTNNLSLATFVHYAGFTALFAGDLEMAGWRTLLRNPLVRLALPSVSVLVAGHHGRQNGCSEEAFALMRPKIVVFSDDSIQFETQKTSSWYGARTSGIQVHGPRSNSLFGETRKVLTTRQDGTIRINVEPDGRFIATTAPSTNTKTIGILPSSPRDSGAGYLGDFLGAFR